jgi:hypothetical protein
MEKVGVPGVSTVSWRIIATDKETGLQKVVLLAASQPQPIDGAAEFLCGLEEEHSLVPNDFGSPCP